MSLQLLSEQDHLSSTGLKLTHEMHFHCLISPVWILLFKYLNCRMALLWWDTEPPTRNIDCVSTADIWWKEG